MDFCEFVKSKYEYVLSNKDLQTLKWFMTLHGKETSYWYFKITKNNLGQCGIQQLFFDGNTKNNFPLFFTFMRDFSFDEIFHKVDNEFSQSEFRDPNTCNYNEFCLIGELIEDNFSNKIFLIQDIICMTFIELNLAKKHEIIHTIIEKIIPTTLDPFLIQIKILYPYDSQTLDIFFKTILISYNVDMEAILICNDYGWQNFGNFQIIECKNRVNLNIQELGEFLSKIPQIKIINHIMDFYERIEPSKINYSHNEERIFYTKRDPDMNPDIYLLYESGDYSGKTQYALIPSLDISIKMNQMPDEFIQKYKYHEYHQKWIPVLF
jgi:hypothetical protein